MINIGFKILLSNGSAIKIDPDEVRKFLEARTSGKDVLLKQGLFNPSYYVGIVEDKARKKDWLDDVKYDIEKKEKGIPPLKDIFSGIDLGIEKRQNRSALDMLKNNNYETIDKGKNNTRLASGT